MKNSPPEIQTPFLQFGPSDTWVIVHIDNVKKQTRFLNSPDLDLMGLLQILNLAVGKTIEEVSKQFPKNTSKILRPFSPLPPGGN